MSQVKKELTAVEKQENTIAHFFQMNRKKIETVLPKHIDANRLLRIALGELRKNDKLLSCTKESLLSALVQCSQYGLEPGALGLAYLVPYGNECQFQIGYRGMINLARRSQEIVSINARNVYQNDELLVEYGINEQLIHKPARQDPGPMVAAYMVAHFVGGGHHVEFMWKHEIDKIRDETQLYRYWVKNGKKGNTPIWELHYEEMAKKTCIRRGWKYLPMSIELLEIAEKDEAADRGEQKNTIFDGEFESVEESVTPPSSKADALAAAMQSKNGERKESPNAPFDLS